MSGINPIVPDQNGGVYLGGFFNHYEDKDHLYCAEKMSGQDQDIAIRYVSFRELKNSLIFPEEEAETMYRRGGALFIKLEPWSGNGSDDDSFDLEKLVKGEYDKLLIDFAKKCDKFGKPIFLTFGHEPQSTHVYPWGKNPKLYKEAFRYVHDLVEEHADNITWVWNPNVASVGDDLFKLDPNDGAPDPAKKYYSWIALDGYNPRSGATLQDIFERSLDSIKKKDPAIPVMIGEFASSEVDRSFILNDAMDYIASNSNTIKAFLYFNVDTDEQWAITNPRDQMAYRNALKKHETLFRNTIQLADKSYLIRKEIGSPEVCQGNDNCCLEIEGFYFDSDWKEKVSFLEKEVEKLENNLTGQPKSDIIRWIPLTKLYFELSKKFNGSKKGSFYHEKTKETLMKIEKMAKLDFQISIKSQIQLAELYLTLAQNEEIIDNRPYYFCFSPGYDKAIETCDKLLKKHPSDIIAVRSKLIKANALFIKAVYSIPEWQAKQFNEAIYLYDEVIGWVKKETDISWATEQWYIPNIVGKKINGIKVAYKTGEIWMAQEKLIYTLALSSIGKAGALARQNRLEEAFEIFKEIIKWEAVGLEKAGLLDIAHKCIIEIMFFSLRAGNRKRPPKENYEKAIEMFEKSLPWNRLNTCQDLKKSLNLEGIDFEKLSSKEKWELLFKRLQIIPLEPKYREKLKAIRSAFGPVNF